MTGGLSATFRVSYPGGFAVEFAAEQIDGVLVLFGPSGCGKTTVLRALAGLVAPASGRIELAGRVLFDAAAGVNSRPQARGVGFLFQDYALFPHMTARQNVAFPLAELPRAERNRTAGEWLARFDLAEFADRYPRELSGGQQQRVALARALAARPRLLLLDEPLAALDAATKDRLRPDLRATLAATGVPAVVVTHDRTDAVALGDRIAVMDAGHVRQLGPVLDVFNRPADAVVAAAVGVETLLPGTVVRQESGVCVVRVAGGEVAAASDLSGDVIVSIRGEDVALARASDAGSARNRWPGVVAFVRPEGALVRVGVDVGFPLTALVTRPAADELGLAAGVRVVAAVKATAVHLIARA